MTLGADKGCHAADFVAGLREWGVTPHVAQNVSGRRSRIEARTTRHRGYRQSRKKRKLGEQVFGWMRTVGGLRKTPHRGRKRVGRTFTLTAAAYNLVRISRLVPSPP